ncbi:Glucose-1-phosphate thymidylyltransferase [hydrothermal vent metagenome]|uniref:Glucose-1-phosphate thymidylyltransferase n=1 Tax=hydrothermal vent metagenome TaxID=652676 RepID=A0A1W1BS56_9ZZZZ
MKAMILAAGLGSRMRPLTEHTPKPLLEIGGIPLIVWHIERLAHDGFKDIVINIAYLGYKIAEALGDGSEWGVDITYSDEQREGALESAGGIIKALPLLGNEPFLVVNGDIWCEYDFDPKFELESGVLAHLILVANPPHNLQGDFAFHDGKVLSEGSDKYTFSGIGYYHPDLFRDLPYGKQPLAPILRDAMRDSKVSGEFFGGEWRDIGTPERLDELNIELFSTR